MRSDSPLQPFEVLFEARDLPTVELPTKLGRLYGGDLGFHEPRLYANFVSALDGVVAIPSIPHSNDLISAENEADRFLMGLLRTFADVVLIGSGTLRASPRGTWRPDKAYPQAAEAFAELRRRLGRREVPEIAILSGNGSLDPEHPVLASGALVLTSDAGAARLGGRLPRSASVVSLGGDATLDPRQVTSALQERGHRSILSEAGPHTFGSFLAAGLVDELFLTLSPSLAGDAGPSSRLRLVEGADLVPLVQLRPLSIRRHEAHVFLRYELNRLG